MTDSWRPTRGHGFSGTVLVPGSKSESNRALVLAALAESASTVQGVLACRDTDLMLAALQALGAQITKLADTTYQVTPIPRHRTATALEPIEIECGLAGTVMRFVPALAMHSSTPVRFTADPQAGSRPMQPLLQALTDLGAELNQPSFPFTLTPPATITGNQVHLDASASSQFISALLLAGATYPEGLTVHHQGAALPSLPHIEMTVAMLAEHGVQVTSAAPAMAAGATTASWQIAPQEIPALDRLVDPDLTTAAVFLAAAALAQGETCIPHWPARTCQPGRFFLDILRAFGVDVQHHGTEVRVRGNTALTPVHLDLAPAAELVPVTAALAVFASGRSEIHGVGHIRGHETDRIAAIVESCHRVGATATPLPDGLIIDGVGLPGDGLHGGALSSYADHRMAHFAALIGLNVANIVLDDVSCTSKTLPEFVSMWDKLVTSSCRK